VIGGILNFLGGLLKGVAEWMIGYNRADVKEARRINDERQKKQKFDSDLELAAKGDKEAAERVRAGLNRGT